MELQKNKKIAIVSTNSIAISETFIKAQIDFLPATIILHTGWLPTKIGDKYILNKFKRYINYILRPFHKELFSIENAIIKILKKARIEAILAQYGPGGCAMIRVCKKTRIPLFVHFHGFDASDKNTLKEYSESYKLLFKEAKGIIAVSKKMLSKLIELGCPHNKIYLIPYGPNDLFLKINPTFKNETFFSIGRFVDKKAPCLTILAFIEVLKSHSNAKLIIGGEGILLNVCKNIVKAYGIEESVNFPGILRPEETAKYMQNSIAYVQHSVVAESGDSEGTPVAILEASASGLPVIATRHAGIPDIIITNETGFLVEEYDINTMASAMIQLIEDKKLAKRIGLAGKDRILNNFTMDKYIYNLKCLINGKAESKRIKYKVVN